MKVKHQRKSMQSRAQHGNIKNKKLFHFLKSGLQQVGFTKNVPHPLMGVYKRGMYQHHHGHHHAEGRFGKEMQGVVVVFAWFI